MLWPESVVHRGGARAIRVDLVPVSLLDVLDDFCDSIMGQKMVLRKVECEWSPLLSEPMTFFIDKKDERFNVTCRFLINSGLCAH